MSFARGSIVASQETGTPEVVARERADLPRKLAITDPVILRSRAMAFYGQRLDGLTDAEIGRFWGRSREYINRRINGLSEAAKAEVRAKRLRARRAELLLMEAELAEA